MKLIPVKKKVKIICSTGKLPCELVPSG